MDEPIRPDKASDWLLALIERPEDDILRRRFSAWLASDSDNEREWTEVLRTYEVLGQTVPAGYDQWARDPAQPATARAMPAIPRAVGKVPVGGARVRTRRRATIGLAAAAIAACLAFIVLPGAILSIEADVATDTAETRRVELPDGSIVRLGPESAIATNYTGAQRGIRLLKGLAFFEVAPDAGRPFRVMAGHVSATALGTTFEVRRDDVGAAVAVREGVVRVEDRHDGHRISELLRVGEWVRVTADGAARRGTLPADHIASWIDGRLIVTDRSVGDVLSDLRRYYSGMVVLRDDWLARQPLTGVYGLSDPASAIRAIAGAHGVSVYQLSPWIIVVSGS